MFKPPRSLTFDRSAYTNLEDFLRSFNIYLKATGLDAKDDESKIAIFLHHAGKEAQRKFQIFKLTEENRQKYDAVIKAFKDYCKPMKNETYDRYKFFMDCNFGTLEESLLRDKIVHGILDAVLKERLLQQSNLSCKKAEEICRAAEVSHYQVKELDNGNGKQVDVVYTTKTGTKPKGALKDGGLLYDCFKCGRKYVEQAEIPILGLNACTKLQLLKKIDSVGLSFTNKDEFVAKNKEVFEGTDASQTGIGRCLLQNGQPVAFCSRSLTETEIRYPQIDKELLSICFTLNKFHNFVYGRKILVKTDHRPLVAVCNKDFYKVSSRLQRLKLKLIQYNFNIEYLPGRYMFIADLLS
ncbi:hypothetical protein ILUMI_08706 [Ignelater luminosus]|uniref:Reverse transcriptase RNase H-like domain-containing protein n=1 Tax=Ignelater luminosus TaxID=2038154 RepID=A0A8K0GFQ1_IGNLU|nr:hypothetical protein ILUMI_08706 [Ignelater luminosus]